MKSTNASKDDYLVLIEIWEKSVRATHNFLPEENIKTLKPLILDHYFDAVDLRVARDDSDKILGFIGIAEGNVEMLFISPDSRHSGVGSFLLNNAIKYQHASKVDVNEENIEAIGFYKHLGFKVFGRSPLDGQGNPFPLLHMKLEKI
jgi:putative acetyltransferase